MSVPIEDYALIGDRRTAALVGRNGSIDWLCLPDFGSDACFAALLGSVEHGHWQISPTDHYQVSRRYQADTLVLETDFETSAGSVRLIDFMPVNSRVPAVIRTVVGLRGDVSMALEALFRFEYGHIRPLVSSGAGGLQFVCGARRIGLRSPFVLAPSADRIDARFPVRAGDRLDFVMVCSVSDEGAPGFPDPGSSLEETVLFWRSWVGTYHCRTPWDDAVKRSLITIKALIQRSSGGMIAAPTMGLPERLGGSLNWDYRYCWLRDATFMLTALLNAGYHGEAKSWRDWILRVAAGSPEKLQILYQVDGSRSPNEETLPWLPGYAGSIPVRRGNAASNQRQLDVFGEVIDAFCLARRAGIPAIDGEFELQSNLAGVIERIWQQPDKGLWEARGQARNFTYSRVMAWVGLTRFINDASKQPGTDRVRLDRLTALAKRIHAQVCREAYDAERGHFVEYYGSPDVDGSLLLLPLVGFLPANDPRIQQTIAAVRRDLMDDGLVLRRRVASTGETEGAFIACTCWLADCLAMQGELQQAREVFERVLEVRNDVGLLAEEYDTGNKRQAGNFPQALSHLALINTALQLSGPVLQRAGG